MWTAIISAIVAVIGIVANVGMQHVQNAHLTGSQREANDFTASMQEDAQAFNAEQAQINREWNEQQYLKYQTPEAMVRQYQNAGLNPALMFGGYTPQGVSSSSTASSGAGSSVAGNSGVQNIASVLSMLPQMLLTKSQIEKNEAETRNTEADTEKTSAETENVISQTELNHIDTEYKPLMYEIGYKMNLQQFDFNEKKFEQELEQGYLNIKATSVAITRSWEEIKNLIEERKLTISKTQTEDLQHALTAAQTVLVKLQGEGVSLENFQKQFKNQYRSLYNADPDSSWSTQAFGFATKGAQFIENILNKVLGLK